MSGELIKFMRVIAGLIVGFLIAYAWKEIRGEEDILLLAGIGIFSAIMVFALLHLTGKGSH